MLTTTYTLTRCAAFPSDFTVKSGSRTYHAMRKTGGGADHGLYFVTCFDGGVRQFEQMHGSLERLVLEFIEGDIANDVRRKAEVQLIREGK